MAGSTIAGPFFVMCVRIPRNSSSLVIALIGCRHAKECIGTLASMFVKRICDRSKICYKLASGSEKGCTYPRVHKNGRLG